MNSLLARRMPRKSFLWRTPSSCNIIGVEALILFQYLSVFNHYNRVRANLASTAENFSKGASEHSDRMLNLYPVTRHSLWFLSAQSGVISAEIHPHHYRSFTSSIPLQLRHKVPVFEKSNVLVMYALYARPPEMTLQL
jgi:ATP-dependent Clp protease ATP-binding subunit ClpX